MTVILARTDVSVDFFVLVVVAVDHHCFRYLVSDAAVAEVGSVDLARQQHHRCCRRGSFESSFLPESTVSACPLLWMIRWQSYRWLEAAKSTTCWVDQ